MHIYLHGLNQSDILDKLNKWIEAILVKHGLNQPLIGKVADRTGVLWFSCSSLFQLLRSLKLKRKCWHARIAGSIKDVSATPTGVANGSGRNGMSLQTPATTWRFLAHRHSEIPNLLRPVLGMENLKHANSQ